MFNHGNVTAHQPEIILNNFNTRLGHRVGRFLGSFFPHVSSRLLLLLLSPPSSAAAAAAAVVVVVVVVVDFLHHILCPQSALVRFLLALYSSEICSPPSFFLPPSISVRGDGPAAHLPLLPLFLSPLLPLFAKGYPGSRARWEKVNHVCQQGWGGVPD